MGFVDIYHLPERRRYAICRPLHQQGSIREKGLNMQAALAAQPNVSFNIHVLDRPTLCPPIRILVILSGYLPDSRGFTNAVNDDRSSQD